MATGSWPTHGIVSTGPNECPYVTHQQLHAVLQRAIWKKLQQGMVAITNTRTTAAFDRTGCDALLEPQMNMTIEIFFIEIYAAYGTLKIIRNSQ